MLAAQTRRALRTALALSSLAALLSSSACTTRREFGVARTTPQRNAAPTRPSLQWVTTAPPDSGVTFRLPGRPQVTQRTEHNDDGAERYETTAFADMSFGYYAIFVARWEYGIVGNPMREVAQAAAAIFERAQFSRERSRLLTVEGYYAREDAGASEAGAQIRIRHYVGSDRVVVAVTVEQSDAQDVGSYFLNSIGLDRANVLFPADGDRRADGSWTSVYMPESDFAVAMPAAPSHFETEVVIEGATRRMQGFQSRDGWGLYRVRVLTFGDGVPEAAYEELARHLAFGRDVRPVHSSGFPGRVFVTDVGEQRSWARMFQTQGRIYVVEAIGQRRSLSSRAVAQTLLRYFESFRILG